MTKFLIVAFLALASVPALAGPFGGYVGGHNHGDHSWRGGWGR